MKLLTDFFPIVLFFIGYKLFDIYIATGIAIAASLVQVVFYRIRFQRFEKIHLFSLAVISILGGATLFFHDPLFIKWKPTGVYWISALVFWGSMLMGEKSLIRRMMDGNIALPDKIWLRLNHAWAIFFLLMGFLNLYVAYSFSLDAWVNFKLFGGLGLTLIFVFIQALYLTRHIDEKAMRQESSKS